MAPLQTDSQPTMSFSARDCLENTKEVKQGSDRRSVHFEERVRAKRTIHVNEFTAEEIRTCWYSDKEFKTMKDEVRNAGEFIEQGLFETDTADRCRRGAKAHGPLQTQSRRTIKRAVRKAVLEEQELQFDEGSYDPEFIAEVSSIKSAQSQASARQAGLDDELAVSSML